MKNKSKTIGITLLFAKKQKKYYRAILRSYIVSYRDFNDFKKIAFEIGEKNRSRINPEVLIGIYDIFPTYNEFKSYNIVGSSRYFSDKVTEKILGLDDIKKVILSSDINDVNWFLCQVVYSYKDKKDLIEQYKIESFIPLKSSEILEEINLNFLSFNKIEFLKKYKIFYDLNPIFLNFNGIVGITPIYKFPENGDEYLEYFSNGYRNINAIKKLIPKLNDLLYFLDNKLYNIHSKEISKKINQLFSEKRINLAIKVLDQELDNKPLDHWLLAQLGYAFYLKKEFHSSEEYLTKAFKIEPNCPLVIDSLAHTYAKLNKHKEAIILWQKILRKKLERLAYGKCGEDMKTAKTLVIDAHYNIGLSFYLLKNYKKAIKYIKKHLDIRERGIYSNYKKSDMVDTLNEVILNSSQSH